MSAIDWTTTEGCEACNEHGPFLPAGLIYNPEAAREAHQAWHAVVAGILPWQRIFYGAERLTDVLTLPRRKP